MTKNNHSNLAPLIAIIGCDGSGKSTVSEKILDFMQTYGPTETAHLGKQAGNLGRTLSGLPLIGSLLGKLIRNKTKSVNSNLDKNKTPSIFPALVMYMFTLRRVLRFRRMLALRRQGYMIVTDRFPQIEYPGSYDGPTLSLAKEGNFFVRWLARRELNAFKWMTSYQPDLVIRLNVDIETAFARKPDHRRELLEAKIAATPLLKFNGAPIVEIDSAQPLGSVLAEAKIAIARILEARGYTQKTV